MTTDFYRSIYLNKNLSIVLCMDLSYTIHK